MDVGFIGLGQMGKAIAANLVRAGHHVRVWNRSPASAQALVELGAQRVPDPAAALHAEVLLSMLADDAAHREVLLDERLLGRAHLRQSRHRLGGLHP
jgi:3-hydroxyisobutyrate dehydrogenase-like beta-hydroxyacid dehydrogenase